MTDADLALSILQKICDNDEYGYIFLGTPIRENGNHLTIDLFVDLTADEAELVERMLQPEESPGS